MGLGWGTLCQRFQSRDVNTVLLKQARNNTEKVIWDTWLLLFSNLDLVEKTLEPVDSTAIRSWDRLHVGCRWWTVVRGFKPEVFACRCLRRASRALLAAQNTEWIGVRLAELALERWHQSVVWRVGFLGWQSFGVILSGDVSDELLDLGLVIAESHLNLLKAEL